MIKYWKQSTMYSTFIGFLPYVISAFLLFLEYIFNNFVFLLISIAMFMIWDFLYYRNPHTTVGRTADSVNNSTHTARSQTSYFLPFYVLLFGYFFTLEPSKQKDFIDLCNNANVSIWLIVLPFLISCVGLLFMPVQVSKADQTVTNAQKSILAFTALTQQSVILILAHTVLRLSTHLAKIAQYV